MYMMIFYDICNNQIESFVKCPQYFNFDRFCDMIIHLLLTRIEVNSIICFPYIIKQEALFPVVFNIYLIIRTHNIIYPKHKIIISVYYPYCQFLSIRYFVFLIEYSEFLFTISDVVNIFSKTRPY